MLHLGLGVGHLGLLDGLAGLTHIGLRSSHHGWRAGGMGRAHGLRASWVLLCHLLRVGGWRHGLAGLGSWAADIGGRV